MKLSEANKTNLYASISDPITDLRIKKLRAHNGNSDDDELFALQKTIWLRVQKALNLDGPP